MFYPQYFFSVMSSVEDTCGFCYHRALARNIFEKQKREELHVVKHALGCRCVECRGKTPPLAAAVPYSFPPSSAFPASRPDRRASLSSSASGARPDGQARQIKLDVDRACLCRPWARWLTCSAMHVCVWCGAGNKCTAFDSRDDMWVDENSEACRVMPQQLSQYLRSPPVRPHVMPVTLHWTTCFG